MGVLENFKMVKNVPEHSGIFKNGPSYAYTQ